MNKQNFTIYSPASSKFALLPQNNVCFYKVSNITRSMVSPLLPTPLVVFCRMSTYVGIFLFLGLNLDKKRQLWNEATFKWSEIIHFKAWNHTNLCLEHMPGRDQWWGWSLLNGAAEGREANRQTYRGGSKSYSLSGQSMQKEFIDTRKHRHEKPNADYENKNV